MAFIKGNQIAAARALLGWDQKDVAERVGLSVAAISKIEKGENTGRAETLDRIEKVFDAAGLEFTTGEGVRKKEQTVTIYRGHEGFRSFFDDVYEIASTVQKPDICITNVDEGEYDRWLASYEPVHATRMAQLKSVKLRVLLREHDTHLTSTAYCMYRWVLEEQFADVSLYIYGDKSAFIEFSEDDVSVTVVDNPAVTDSLRKMFDLAWDNALTEPRP